jgi:cobalt-zinc-cadmium efflux system protein
MEHSHQPETKVKKDHPHDENVKHSHQPGFRSYERKRLLIAIILTGAMMVGEVIGGIVSGSLALLSDAGHMLTHSFALLISFLAILYACRPATREKSFGFYRAEIIAALFNGITLLIITGFILWEAYKRILNPIPISEIEMIIVAVIGLIVNVATALILWKASRESLNVRSAFVHMIGDTASSIGVVIGAVIIYITGFYIIDPIISILIAAVILVWSITLIRDSVRILMESAPKNIDVNELKENLIKGIAPVKDLHDLHVWEITSGMYCLTAHVIIDDMSISQTEKVLKNINHFLLDKYNIQHPIIQFESGEGFKHEEVCQLDIIRNK